MTNIFCFKPLLAIGPVALLAACGGGGTGIASAPSPIVVSPPPSPAPPGSLPGAAFPSSAPPTYYSTSHISSVVNSNMDQDANGTAQLSGINARTFDGSPGLGNFEYRGPDNYAVEFYGFGGPEFKPASKISSTEQFDRFRNAEPEGHFSNLELARKDGGLNLTYSSFGNVIYSVDRPDHVEVTFFAVGSTTPQGQIPTSGSASYTGIADGFWIDGPVIRRLYGSTARLTANFVTGELNSVLELRGHDDPFGNFADTPTTSLGVFNGMGTISGSYFKGNYNPTAGYTGSYSGEFFGPSAEEAGWAFRLNGEADQTVFGAAVGKR